MTAASNRSQPDMSEAARNFRDGTIIAIVMVGLPLLYAFWR